MRIAVLALSIAAAATLAGCPKAPMPPADSLIPESGAYDVTIHRDPYGVPHVYGETDPDVSYGLAYAHAEDDFYHLHLNHLLARGRMAMAEGISALPFDYLAALFQLRDVVAAAYGDFDPATKALCEAYADGYNHYAALHPEEVIDASVLPATGQDIVLGFVIKGPLFFGLRRELTQLFEGGPRSAEAELATASLEHFLPKGLPIGSNTFSVSPKRSANGETMLAINSHQPWTGPVAWYEARLKSNTGYDMVGGLFPGTPVILHGHNRHLGWAHTVNKPDLIDIYELEINPDDPYQYRLDGEWRDLERGEATLHFKLWGSLRASYTRETLYSEHGPVMRLPHGTYALKYASYGDIRAVEQWYKMGRATTFEEFQEVLDMRGIPCFNIGYADKTGNIAFFYNALFPVRAEGYDWQSYLPGDDSSLIWTDYLPRAANPAVINPETGFVQSCNSTPYRTTVGDENPDPEAFSPTLGIEPYDLMTNRSLRALEILSADESITPEEFVAYKFDQRYSQESDAVRLRTQILAQVERGDPIVDEALDVLAGWDLGTERANTGTAIAILTMEPVVRAEIEGKTPPDLIETFIEKAKVMHAAFGRIDVPWGEVNRLVRGNVDVPLDGGPDVLRAVYGGWDEDRQALVGEGGDCYVLMVTWQPDGSFHSRSIHQFGSATLDATSPHYADQAPLFASLAFKPTYFEEADLMAVVTQSYRPGDEVR